MKIYTRQGDKGETSLYTGERVPKDHAIIEAIGAVDECNCSIGVALTHVEPEEKFLSVRSQLETIQHALFDLGAAFATPRTRASSSQIDKTRFGKEATVLLESWIDKMEEGVPPLKTFILPGGVKASAHLHVARSLCRRAERLAIAVHRQGDLPDAVLIYLNRLSDYLFVLARFVNHQVGFVEMPWKPQQR